jgi:hypothetical protein
MVPKRIAVGFAAMIVVLLPWVAHAPQASAWLAGPGGLETFAVNGTWGCTNASCTTIAGSGACLESEVEWWSVTPAPVLADFAVAAGCTATYNGVLQPVCIVGVCTFTGTVNVTFTDASDPGYRIGPIPVTIAGAIVLEDAYLGSGHAHAGHADAAMAAADVYTVDPLLVWSGAGALHGHCDFNSIAVNLSACNVAGVFELSLTGVQV